MQLAQFYSSHSVSRAALPAVAHLHCSVLHLVYTIYYSGISCKCVVSFCRNIICLNS